MRTFWILAVACALVFALSSDRADAGTYTVSGCRIGWVPDVRITNSSANATFDLCDLPNAPPALYASFGAAPSRVSPGDHVGFRFDAPADTSIAALRLRWNGQGDYAGGDWGAAVVNLDTSAAAMAKTHIDQFSLTESVSALDAQWVRAYVGCIAPSGWTCRSSYDSGSGATSILAVTIYSSSITLTDRFAPQPDSVAGSATTDSVWTGSEQLSFNASDLGSGIYRVLVDVDGQVVKAMPAVADDRCVDRTGARDFGHAVPCPGRASGNVAVDASDLPAGQHTVTVYLEDAAGNRAILMAPTQKLVVNDYRAVGYFAGGRFFNPRFGTPRSVNGEGAVGNARIAASFVRVAGKGGRRHRVVSARREVRFSQRPTIKGTLAAPSGEPIRGATVFIGQQPEGQQWRLDGAVRTDSAGRFSYRPAARQPNRDLRVVYFPFSDSHEHVASSPLTLKVAAGLTLRVSRHALRNGQRLAFTGRVLGAVPPQGVAVTLQAKVGRHYRSFRQLRATARTGGAIRTIYRFERTTATVRYRFRLKLVRQAGLAYQGGVSPTVAVLVRP